MENVPLADFVTNKSGKFGALSKDLPTSLYLVDSKANRSRSKSFSRSRQFKTNYSHLTCPFAAAQQFLATLVFEIGIGTTRVVYSLKLEQEMYENVVFKKKLNPNNDQTKEILTAKKKQLKIYLYNKQFWLLYFLRQSCMNS